MRWVLAVLAVVVAAAAVGTAFFLGGRSGSEPAAFPASAMPGRLLVGFQDDASFRWAPDRAQSLDVAQRAGASVVRTIVEWRQVAPTRPASPADSFDPAYRLDDLDDLARSAQQRGIELLVTVWGTPGWANGGAGPNVPPLDDADFGAFAQALADRYSGRHPGFPAVRLFSIWNEPNLEQFLAPQFDESGRSTSPGLYAELVRAGYAGIKRGNSAALVAIGETSPYFDAWAQHPYPSRHTTAPAEPTRWPRISLSNLERFGASLDEWLGDGEEVPVWVTEYGHETTPFDPTGVDPETQARYVTQALALAAGNPRIRLFAWFILRDRSFEPWQSGLVSADGTPKPGLVTFRVSATALDARNPIVAEDSEVARIPALELAFHTPSGAPVEIRVDERAVATVPLGSDGWLELPLAAVPHASPVAVVASNRTGQSVRRTLEIVPTSID